MRIASWEFTPGLWPTLATLLMLPLFMSLGFWQQDRAEQKRALHHEFETRQGSDVIELNSKHALREIFDELRWRKILAEGTFSKDINILLDNQVENGVAGYFVYTPFKLKEQDVWVLVNRGWIAADPSRRQEPTIPEVDGPVLITGHVYVSPGEPYLLADTALESGWPKRIQAIEMDKFEAVVKQNMNVELFPHPVRIDSGVAAALTVDWQVVNVSPEKHTGYAVQWFTMAAALFILFILRSTNLWQVLTGGSRTQ